MSRRCMEGHLRRVCGWSVFETISTCRAISGGGCGVCGCCEWRGCFARLDRPSHLIQVGEAVGVEWNGTVGVAPPETTELGTRTALPKHALFEFVGGLVWADGEESARSYDVGLLRDREGEDDIVRFGRWSIHKCWRMPTGDLRRLRR